MKYLNTYDMFCESESILDQFISYLNELKSRIIAEGHNEKKEFGRERIVEMYYTAAIKNGIKHKIISNKVRLKINKFNKSIGSFSRLNTYEGFHWSKGYIDGIDLIINLLNPLIESQIFESNSNLNSNFKKWFGKSKVVGKDKKPLIVYHGTKNKFDTFDISKISSATGNDGHYGYGFYLSYDESEAKIYGEVVSCYVRINNPFTGNEKEMEMLLKQGVSGIDDLEPQSLDFDSLYKEISKLGKAESIYTKAYKEHGVSKAWKVLRSSGLEPNTDINMLNDILEYSTANPNVYNFQNYVFDIMKELGIDVDNVKVNMAFGVTQMLHWVTDLGNNSKGVTDIIKKLGYDGVIYGSEIVAFYPNQIKSIENDGTWSLKNNNIYS